MDVISWLVLLAVLVCRELTRPQFSEKNAVRNSIQLFVEMNRHLADSDKIVLIAKLLDDIEFEKLDKTQIELLIEKIERKIAKL